MRFLLLSNTYGKLGIINELAAGVRADAVIHAGDFGFFDDRSYERLSERELLLQIIHSELPLLEKGKFWPFHALKNQKPRTTRLGEQIARSAMLEREIRNFLRGVSFDIKEERSRQGVEFKGPDRKIDFTAQRPQGDARCRPRFAL